ncbi:MAG: shikimate kinase [Rubrivivax sp.]|nr:shikimate kinase [Rubrivivax sp.]
MPGSGKSTVGRQVARHLKLRFVDSDHEIERRTGMPVRSYFETQGEAAFRDLEQQLIAELAVEGGIVLATGGGSVLRAANREALRAHRRVIYLRATPEELHRRLRHDTQRPLLQVADPLRRLRELFRERDPLYLQTAHYTVEAARPSVATLVNMVLMQLELNGEWQPAPFSAEGDPPAGTSPEGDPPRASGPKR